MLYTPQVFPNVVNEVFYFTYPKTYIYIYVSGQAVLARRTMEQNPNVFPGSVTLSHR